jgi:hypothetical protein
MAERSDGEDVIGGYYTFDVGTWRFIVLNSGENCNELGPVCDDGSGSWPSPSSRYNDQADYLEQQLDNNTQPCVAVAFHAPRWSSDITGVWLDGHGDSKGGGDAFETWWDIMYKGLAENENDHRVDLVLNGHDHFYERFGKMDEMGASASNGIRQIIAGTGGRSIRGVDGTTAGQSEAKNPVLADSAWDTDTTADDYPNKTAGALELVLKPNGYQYRFIPSADNSPTDNGDFNYPDGGRLTSEVSCNADGS